MLGRALLVYQKVLYGLALLLVQRVSLVAYTPKVYLRKVDATYGVVVGCLVIHSATSEVDGRCPLRCARHIWGLAFGVFDADGHVEVVEQMEGLQDGLLASWLLGC